MATSSILKALVEMDEAPWADMKGKPLDSLRLANLLRPYGIRSKTIRDEHGTPKGYTRRDLHDAWMRYLSAAVDDAVQQQS
jgi:hypothetical protein